MLNPRSRAGGLASSVFRRRPSAAMVVALVALFLAAGGVSYAATALPRNSVGTDQLQNSAVTNHKLGNNSVGNRKIQNNAVGFRKIQPGAIGVKRVNRGAVQLRVSGTCAAGGQAITAVQNTGNVTCGSTTPASFNGGQSDPVAITSPTSAVQITGVSLAAGSSYVVMANPQISVNAASTAFGHVSVSCTLSVGGAATATQMRTQSFDLGFGQTTPANNGAQAASRTQTDVMPLMVSAASSTAAEAATVSCTATPAGTRIGTPQVTAAGTITALQTSSNTTLQSTVTTPGAPPAAVNPPASTDTSAAPGTSAS